jgi:hypothetical protein
VYFDSDCALTTAREGMFECVGDQFVEDQPARYCLVDIQLDIIQLHDNVYIRLVAVNPLQVIDKNL